LIERYVCIHGHFYQPPRENPWLGVIEVQDSSAPFHDWNERITAECYRPNSRSRILDPEGWIEHIVNNYSRMSFDFGPTLLSWLEEFAPDVYAAVLQADRDSAAKFGGHGSAIAQAYNHMIMPLANSRDKRTQVLWGITDFVRRFKRRPEGMWLPETAVDLESLDIMAENGIIFTILEPAQAARVRGFDRAEWRDVSDGSIDPRRPYEVRLASGRSISVFFYDGPASRAVAFEGLLAKGETFAERLTGLYAEGRGSQQLAHVATDGETYGHHHRFGDMALAYVLDYFDASEEVTLANYGQYLEMFPPQHEVEIAENTSWSCAHGIERWRADCGCTAGAAPGWDQAWRAPLRRALDWLRDELAPGYEDRAGQLLRDPWADRDDYLRVVADRSAENVDAFLQGHAITPLEDAQRITALKLLELQHHAMLMFTSCGWFFNDIAGIETIQVLQYAGRAVQLAQEVFGDHLEEQFESLLADARSNVREQGDGQKIYQRYVQTAKVDLPKALSHYAVSSLFDVYGYREKVFDYTVEQQDFRLEEAGRTRLALGLAHITSDITGESMLMSFGVVHLGDQNITGGLRAFQGARDYNDMVRELRQTFLRGELTDVIHSLDRLFPGRPFSLRSLFRDEQRKIVRQIMQPALEDAERVYRDFYEEHTPLFRFLTHINFPLPKRFHAAADFALNIELRRELQRDDINQERVASVIEEARLVGIEIDRDGLGFELQENIDRLAAAFAEDPSNAPVVRRLLSAVETAASVDLPVDLAQSQNALYDATRADPRRYEPGSEAGKLILLLAGSLKVRPSAA